MCAQTRPYFRPTWPLFCSLAVSLVKLCRCTVAIRAVGPEARHVAETTAALRSIRGAESSKSKNLQRRGHRGGSIAEAMVPAAAASTSAAASASPSPSRTAAADAVQLKAGRGSAAGRLRRRPAASLPRHCKPPALGNAQGRRFPIWSLYTVDIEMENIAMSYSLLLLAFFISKQFS